MCMKQTRPSFSDRPPTDRKCLYVDGKMRSLNDSTINNVIVISNCRGETWLAVWPRSSCFFSIKATFTVYLNES